MNFNSALLCLYCIAPLQAVAEQSSAIRFAIKPITCMVKQAGQACEMTAKITWQSQQKKDLCLYQQQLQLACWQQTQKVSTNKAIKLEKTMRFTLKNSQHQVVAEQMIEVHSSANQKYRRKLKSDWSVF